MAAADGPIRVKEFRDARAEAADTDKAMDIDSQTQPVGDGEDLYTQLKLWQRQLEFYEIQVDSWCQDVSGRSSDLCEFVRRCLFN